MVFLSATWLELEAELQEILSVISAMLTTLQLHLCNQGNEQFVNCTAHEDTILSRLQYFCKPTLARWLLNL
jgi:hypothetical protein